MEHPRYVGRTTEWGNWGITFMNPQPDRTKNFGVIVGQLNFAVGNQGPIDGTIGSPIRQKYENICKAWIDQGELPAGVLPYQQQ